MRLWRCDKDGVPLLKELEPSMFGSADDYQQAVDHAYADGFCDTITEAKEQHELQSHG